MSDNTPKIYTKTGDDGYTGRLFGGRVRKDDDQIQACGDIDETVACLGMARAALPADDPLAAAIVQLQRQLFVAAADLMTNPKRRDQQTDGISRVTPAMVGAMEKQIDDLVTQRPLKPIFIVPGATPPSAALDMARAVIRRAERSAIRARQTHDAISDEVLHFLNRASDLIFVLARHAAGPEDELPSHD